jgi:Spy/CpxP family protein refolding chaperone
MKIQPVSMMKSLRMAACLFTVMLISAATLFAQGNQPGKGRMNGSPDERAKRQTEMMKDNLSLTAAQEPKVSAINLKYAKKMEDVRKVTDTAAQRKAIQSLNKQKDGELKAVLTPEQFKTYQKFMEEFKARRRDMQH